MDDRTDSTIWLGVDRLIDTSPGLDDLRAHGLQLLAARRWRSLGQPVPADLVREELWTALRVRAAVTLLERIRAACEGPIILMKGLAVAAYYPDHALRPFHDLDLLVGDAPAVQASLLRSGFQLSPAELHPDTEHHLQPVRAPEFPLYVELHRYPSWIDGWQPPSLEQLLAGAEPADLGVDGILTLAPSVHALVVAAHLWARDPLTRLLNVIDAAALAEASDAVQLQALADAWGMTKPWAATTAVADAVLHGARRPWALRTWARYLPAAREASVLQLHLGRCLSAFSALPPRHALRALRRALRGYVRPLPNESWRRKVARTAEQLRRPSMRRSEHVRSAQESWVQWSGPTGAASAAAHSRTSSPQVERPPSTDSRADGEAR